MNEFRGKNNAKLNARLLFGVHAYRYVQATIGITLLRTKAL